MASFGGSGGHRETCPKKVAQNEVFDFPKDHVDYEKNIAAYYYWVFPNMMFNFYPWGLSINVVKPLSVNKTKVSWFRFY